mmetsp:Transcript_1130/g.2170  ORF Transcript_1130/g.2170 Transcript_1130/m.2170 type:complete len:84 (-) Transcript_1130:281-532(-)
MALPHNIARTVMANPAYTVDATMDVLIARIHWHFGTKPPINAKACIKPPHLQWQIQITEASQWRSCCPISAHQLFPYQSTDSA